MFLLVWGLAVCVFQEIGLFYLNYCIMGIELFTVFLYYLFNIQRTSSDEPSSIADIGNTCHLSFLLVNQILGLSILSIFSENQLWLHWYSLLFPLFSISLIYALVFIISFPLVALGLISSSFIDLLGVILGYWFFSFLKVLI